MSEKKYFNENIVRLQNLIDDLKKLRDGKSPRSSVLDESPILNNWNITTRPALCLEGLFLGHPLIADRSYGITSEVYFIDPEKRYVRTLSRFYRLGIHANEHTNSDNQ